MRRRLLLVLILALGGCYQAPKAAPPALPPPPPPKTAIIRAMMGTLGEMRLPRDQARFRDALCRQLRASDAELAKVWGGAARQMILRANQKPQLRFPVPGASPQTLQRIMPGESAEAAEFGGSADSGAVVPGGAGTRR